MSDYSDYVYRNNHLSNITPDQTVIIKKSLLRLLPGVKFEEDQKFAPPSEEWYPYVNSYYPFTEDVDAFARVSHLLESKRSMDSFDKELAYREINEYSERKTHRQFLRKRPMTFLILGKPGMGEEEIGRRLAEYWKCVYIDPLTLLEEEIALETRAGQCIEFNLRCGRAVGIDILLRLLTKKVQTPAVLHRGFVCCGFPLIPNELYEEDPISSESAIFNVKEIFEEMIDQTIRFTDFSNKVEVSMIDEESGQTEKESVEEHSMDESGLKMSLEWSIENQICGPTDISTDLEKQLNCLFGVFHEPYLLIYIYGKNSDVITRRDNYFYDVYSKNTIDLQKIGLFYEIGASNEFLTEDLFDNGRNPFAENPELKHLVKVPENMPANVSTQLDQYHTIANQIDGRVLVHDIQYYLKLDGRCFISQMMNSIKSRLEVLPLQKAVIPERFNSTFELHGEGVENEETMTLDEAFLKFSKQNTIGSIFKWSWSDWGTLCPVSMFQGVYQNGSPNHAVHFLNKIYFLNSENALEKFEENPRPYLLPPFPKPGSRVFVFGPPISGKSAVSKCLGYLLNSRVLTASDLHKEYFDQMVHEERERVKQMAIAESLEILKVQKIEEREKKLEERKEEIKGWEEQVIELLSHLALLWQKKESEQAISSFPLRMPQSILHRRSMDEDAMIRESLISLNLPYIENLEQCNKFLKNRSVLLEHLPKNLKTEISEEIPSVFDSFVISYVESKLQTVDLDEIKLKVHENVYEMYARGIKTSEEQADHDGWIIDGMTTDLRLLKQVLEDFSIDDIIVLDCSDYDYLLQRFKQFKKNQMHFRDFRDFFLQIGEKDAAWRTPSIISTDSYKKQIIDEVLSDVIRSGFDEVIIEGEREVLTEEYQQDLNLYQKEIRDVKVFFDESKQHANYIDVKDLTIEDLLREAIDAVQGRYRRKATEFTDEDRAEEIQQMLANLVQSSEGEGGTNDEVDDFLARNRRYGDTYYYCPVTFAENFVLWRGKEQFAAKFKEKIYLMANETNLRKFIKYPRRYLIQNSPNPRFPPPRICIVGCGAKDKTLVAKKLAKNLGVRYLSFKTLKQSAVDALSSISLLVNAEDGELPDALTLEWLDTIFQLAFFGNLKYIGFVFDDFPQSANNLNYMIFRGAIPDVIISLTPNFDSYSKQELESSLNEWRLKQEKRRKEEEVINSIILEEWEEKRKVRYNELMDAKRQNRYSKKLQDDLPKLDDEPEVGFASDTQVSFDSVIEQQEHDETMKILDEEFPEPVLEQSQETEEEFIDNATKEIEEKYDNFLKFMEEVKSICNVELIPYHEINSSQDMGKVLRHVYIIGNELKFRGPSFFERCYDVSLDQANKLLNCGFYILSTFGRICPVESYKGENPLHCYIASQQKNQVYPVIHRQYIYFLSGKSNRDKFFKNPLKYTTRKITEFVLVPARVSIIGPPKSGKTSLSDRFRRDLGFRVVTLGESVRYVLSHPLFTNLRQDLEKVLRKGQALPYDLLAECVSAASFCGECVTQGLVFDGFPNSITGMTLLTRFGLVPHLIFDLQISEDRVLELASNPSEKYPQYSQRFIRHLYNEWKKSQELFRIWCDREYQNIYKISVDRSIWGVWEHAKLVTLSVMFERKHYYQHVKADWPLRLANMLVTPLEFLERQSGYKTYCPGCLFYSRKLTNGGDPPDRTGLVQYLSYFYWLCQEHIEEFLKNPDKFLPPSNVCLPQELPKVVQVSEPVHAVEDGYCVVCYQKNFPKKILTRGSVDSAVSYRDKIFLFDGKECLHEFMATPEALCCVTINFKDNIKVSLEYKDLPILGMLEQFVARTVVRACNHANFYRPVIPGLSISQAALVCIGLNLKIHNLGTPHNDKYKKALEVFHERRTNLIKFLDLMKKYLNPAVFYQEPDTPSSTEDSDEVGEETDYFTRRYSSGV